MKRQIWQVAEIQSGYQFRGKIEPEDNANVTVVQMKDIDRSLRLRYNDLIPAYLEKPEPYIINQGDVLFMPRGYHRYALCIERPVRNVVASSVFFILRPDEDVVIAEFLAWLLNQPGFQNHVDSLAQGTTTKLISKTDFSSLKIEVPSIQVQRKIVELQQQFKKEQQLIDQIQNKRSQLIQSISRRLASGQLKIQDT